MNQSVNLRLRLHQKLDVIYPRRVSYLTPISSNANLRFRDRVLYRFSMQGFPSLYNEHGHFS